MADQFCYIYAAKKYIHIHINAQVFYVNIDNIADVYARKGWYELCYNGDYGDNFIEDTVTHWMPLPKPPSHMGGK